MNTHSPTIIDYIKLLKKWQKNILVNICVITLITVILSLIMPKTFTATAVLMPPKATSGNTFRSDSANPLIPLSGLFGNFTDESMNLLSIVFLYLGLNAVTPASRNGITQKWRILNISWRCRSWSRASSSLPRK